MKFAVVFPGQGSQKIGMFEDSDLPTTVRATFSEASEIAGKDLLRLIQEGPLDEINNTVNTQMIMLATGVGFYRYWKEEGGPDPHVIAGHSLGEYAALVSGGALLYTDAVKLVFKRANLMQSAVPQGVGAIAAIIGLTAPQVEEICLEASSTNSIVQPANYNSPTQIVVAGHKDSVERAISLMTKAGAKRAIMLPMSVPSHCSLLSPMLEEFEDALRIVNIDLPSTPVLQNAYINVEVSQNKIRKALLNQVIMPVYWTKTIEAMVDNYSISKIIEIGPGKVLTGLNKRINKDIEAFSFAEISSLNETIRRLEQ